MDLMQMFHQLWQFWVGFFPDNVVLGSRQTTALMALIIVIPALGWLLREVFGRDQGVR